MLVVHVSEDSISRHVPVSYPVNRSWKKKIEYSKHLHLNFTKINGYILQIRTEIKLAS